jgi:2-polyprenyl-3-methyl-5-hydroxy-6-metoxy-1,4-benzoquinol methylase
MINVKQSKSAWEQEYESGSWEFLNGRGEAPRYAVVADQIQTHPGRISLMDVGCGEGVILRYLDLNKIRRYVGLDLAQTPLDRIVPRRSQDRYICSSLEDYSPDEKWDVILFGEVLYYVGDPVDQLRKFEASLNDDGFFVVSMHQKHKWWAYGNRCTRQLKQCFNAHYMVLDHVELIRHANEPLTWEVFVVRPRHASGYVSSNDPEIRRIGRPNAAGIAAGGVEQEHASARRSGVVGINRAVGITERRRKV